MDLAIWLSLLGIMVVVVGLLMLLFDLSKLSSSQVHTSIALYVFIAGLLLIIVPWATYGISIVITIFTSYFGGR